MNEALTNMSTTDGNTRRDISSMEDSQLVALARAYKSATDLINQDRYLYNELVRRGVYDDYVKPYFNPGVRQAPSPFIKASTAVLLEMAARFSNMEHLSSENAPLRGELESRGLWDTAMPRDKNNWDEESITQAAEGLASYDQLAQLQPAAYYWAAKMELLEGLFESRTPGTTTRRRKWTRETIIESAARVSSRSEFHKRFPGAYAAARSLEILDQVCTDMDRTNRRSGATGMTDIELRQIASDYATPNDFLRGNRSAYNQSVRRGIFSSIAQDQGWK